MVPYGGRGFTTFYNFSQLYEGVKSCEPPPSHLMIMSREIFFFLSLHEIKEEIETKHFEHTFAVLGANHAAESPSSPKNKSRCCAFHDNLSPMGCIV